MVKRDRPDDDKGVGNSKDFFKRMIEQRGTIGETKIKKGFKLKFQKKIT